MTADLNMLPVLHGEDIGMIEHAHFNRGQEVVVSLFQLVAWYKRAQQKLEAYKLNKTANCRTTSCNKMNIRSTKPCTLSPELNYGSLQSLLSHFSQLTNLLFRRPIASQSVKQR